jgi:hypothetical protein
VALLAFALTHRARRLEGLGDLVVQFHAVGHDHERPVAVLPAQDLLREEDHRKALAAPLRLPEHTAAAVALGARLQHGANDVIHAQHLVVLSQNLGDALLSL